MLVQISYYRCDHDNYDFKIYYRFLNADTLILDYDDINDLYVDKIDKESTYNCMSQNVIKQLRNINIHSICKNKVYQKCINYNYLIREVVHEKYVC